MTDKPFSHIGLFEESNFKRNKTFLTVAWVSIVGLLMLLPAYGLGYILIPGFPGMTMMILNLVSIFVIFLSLRIQKKHHLETAVLFYLGAMNLAFFVGFFFLGGVLSPLIIILPVLTMFAALLGGRRAAVASAFVGLVIIFSVSLFEAVGWLPDPRLSSALLRALYIFLISFTLLTTVLLLNQFVQSNEVAFSELQRSSIDLAEATKRAEELAEAERAAYERESRQGRQLHAVIREYTLFLEDITDGNYEKHLELDQVAEMKELPEELLSLGRYLNATVESLVSALTDLQAAQRIYLRQSWEAFVQAGVAPGGYHYKALNAQEEIHVDVDENAWLTPMSQAVRSQDIATEGLSLAIPLDTRGQVIGALGIKRANGEEWSEDEITLVNAIGDQLAQTIDNLRLLEDTGRRAAREKAASDVAASIRAEVEIEAVLERALSELGRVLAAERGVARLTLGEQQED